MLGLTIAFVKEQECKLVVVSRSKESAPFKNMDLQVATIRIASMGLMLNMLEMVELKLDLLF